MADQSNAGASGRTWPPALRAILSSMRFHDDLHMTCRVCGLVWKYGDTPQHTDACERESAHEELANLLATVERQESEIERLKGQRELDVVVLRNAQLTKDEMQEAWDRADAELSRLRAVVERSRGEGCRDKISGRPCYEVWPEHQVNWCASCFSRQVLKDNKNP